MHNLFSRKNLKYISIVVILIIIVFAGFRGADNPVKGFFLTVSNPFLKTFRIFSGGTSGFFDFLGSIGRLKKDNEDLLNQNQELIARNNRLKDTEKENQILRNELQLAPKKDYDLEASFIIAQDPHGLGNYFIIDKGMSSGIETGMPVIVSSGILIGKVSNSYQTTAKVLLITDPNSAINAEVEDSGAKGIVKGEYGLGLKISMISQADVINEGDAVITSGLGGGIPRGLTIGRVAQVSQSVDKLFQEASVTPAGGPFQLEDNFCDKEILKNFTLFIFCLLVVFFQLSVEGVFFAGGRIPDLALAFVITLAVANGFERSVWWIILTGLIIDAVSVTIFGMTAIAFLLIGWAIDFLITFADIRSRKAIFLIFLAAAAVVAEFVKDVMIVFGLWIKYHFLRQPFNLPVNIFSSGYLLKIFYTVIATYVIYYLFRKVSRALFIEPIRLAKRKF